MGGEEVRASGGCEMRIGVSHHTFRKVEEMVFSHSIRSSGLRWWKAATCWRYCAHVHGHTDHISNNAPLLGGHKKHSSACSAVYMCRGKSHTPVLLYTWPYIPEMASKPCLSVLQRVLFRGATRTPLPFLQWGESRDESGIRSYLTWLKLTPWQMSDGKRALPSFTMLTQANRRILRWE